MLSRERTQSIQASAILGGQCDVPDDHAGGNGVERRKRGIAQRLPRQYISPDPAHVVDRPSHDRIPDHRVGGKPEGVTQFVNRGPEPTIRSQLRGPADQVGVFPPEMDGRPNHLGVDPACTAIDLLGRQPDPAVRCRVRGSRRFSRFGGFNKLDSESRPRTNLLAKSDPQPRPFPRRQRPTQPIPLLGVGLSRQRHRNRPLGIPPAQKENESMRRRRKIGPRIPQAMTGIPV